MRRFVWLIALIVLSASVSAASPDECYSDCKLGQYGDCLAAGGDEQECYKTAFEPCVAKCPAIEQSPSEAQSTPAAAPVAVDVSGARILPERMTCEEECKTRAYEYVARSPAAVGEEQLVEQFYGRCVKERCQREPTPPVVVPARPPAQPAPSCPSGEATCETRCAHSYYDCMKKARGLMVSEERKSILLHCYEGVGECLDACRPESISIPAPEPMPVVPEAPPDCVTGCKQEYDACSESSTDESECKARADACFRKCAPVPATPAEAAPAEAVPQPALPSLPAQPRGFWKRVAHAFFGS